MPGANRRNFTQLDPGSFTGEISRLEFSGYAISSGRFSHGIVGALRSSRSTMTVSLPMSAEVNGLEVQKGDLVFQWGRTNKIWKTEPDFSYEALELPIEDASLYPDLREWMRQVTEGTVLVHAPDKRMTLRRYIRLARQSSRDPQFCMSGFLAALAAECWGTLSSIRSREVPRRLIMPYRVKVFRRALEIVMAEDSHPPNVAELATHVGVSERALSNSFAFAIGRSPRDFLKLARLGKAREYILKRAAGAESVVTAAAMKFGFWHLGRFSSYYRAQFGEYPSETAATAVGGVNFRRLPRSRQGTG